MNDNTPSFVVATPERTVLEDFMEYEIDNGRSREINFGITVQDLDDPVSSLPLDNNTCILSLNLYEELYSTTSITVQLSCNLLKWKYQEA